MYFAIIVFPGSNCDHDAYHVFRHILDVTVNFVWHQEIDLKKYENNEEVIFEENELFHEGILGIIAGKLKDKLNRPAFVITKSFNFYKLSFFNPT